MKKRIPPTHVRGKNSTQAHLAKTGEHCPVGGWWAPADRHEDQRIFAEGSIMPADKGRSVTWTLVTNVPGGPKLKHACPAAGVN
jgi:hypothetical protein